MTAPKRIDLARIAAGVAEALEKVTVHQVTSVNAELDELADGTRHVGISALIVIPPARRRSSTDDDSEPETVELVSGETIPLPVVGDVPGPAPDGMKVGQTYQAGMAAAPTAKPARPLKRGQTYSTGPALLPDEPAEEAKEEKPAEVES